MDADDFLFRGSHQSQGIGVTQIFLFGKGKFFEFFRGMYRRDTGILQLFSVEAVGTKQRLNTAVDKGQLFIRNFHNK